MSTKNDTIEHLIERIIFLLEKNDEFHWVLVLKNLLDKYCDVSTRDDSIINMIQIFKGGMGSFSDVVLQKNYSKSMSEEEYKNLIRENEEFDRLTDDLYNACVMYSKKMRSY